VVLAAFWVTAGVLVETVLIVEFEVAVVVLVPGLLSVVVTEAVDPPVFVDEAAVVAVVAAAVPELLVLVPNDVSVFPVDALRPPLIK